MPSDSELVAKTPLRRAKLVGYVRVSKADDDRAYDQQTDALIAADVRPENVFLDTTPDPRDARPSFEACLKALAAGDTLLVWRLDRIGRDLGHIASLICDLARRGVGFKVLAGGEASIDTTTANGPLVLAIFASLNNFQRDLNKQAGRKALLAAGVRARPGGRPTKMTAAKVRSAMAAMSDPKTNITHLCRELGVHRQTLYRFVSPTGALREDGRRLLYPHATRRRRS